MIRRIEGSSAQPQTLPVEDTSSAATGKTETKSTSNLVENAHLASRHEQASERRAEYTLSGKLLASQLQQKFGDGSTHTSTSGIPVAGEGAILASAPGSDTAKAMRHPIQDRIRGLEKAYENQPGTVQDLKKLTTDPRFTALELKDQQKVLNIFTETTPDGRAALAKLLQKDVNGNPALTTRGINDKDTLLDQLDRLGNSKLDGRLAAKIPSDPPQFEPIAKEKVLEDLMQEVADPDRTISQNARRGTCAPTAMTHKLAQENPAEYARLVADLATTGESKLANGDKIRVPGYDSWQPDGSIRSHGERLLQSSLMAYGRPDDEYINWQPGGRPGSPEKLDGFKKGGDGGLFPKESARVMTGLFGKEYNSYKGTGAEMRQRIENELREGRQPVLIGIDWEGGSHAVEVVGIKDGQILFRNPDPSDFKDKAAGTELGNAQNTLGGPLRRIVDSERSTQSMSIEEFQKHVNTVYGK